MTTKELKQLIKESVRKALNEGAGAGYLVTIEGLKGINVKFKRENEIVRFTADIEQGLVDWKAEGYYETVTSEGFYYNGELISEFDDQQKMVNGGKLKGYVFVDAIEDYENSEVNDEQILSYINYVLDGFSFSKNYGGGWVHVNLPEPMVFKDFEIGTEYMYLNVDELELNAKGISDTINWYFANSSEFDELYGGEKTNDEYLDEKRKQLNEIGDTAKGQEKLGAVHARRWAKNARNNYKKTGKTEHKPTADEIEVQDYALKQRTKNWDNGKRSSEELDSIYDKTQAFNRGNNRQKATEIRKGLTESKLRNIVKESIRKYLRH